MAFWMISGFSWHAWDWLNAPDYSERSRSDSLENFCRLLDDVLANLPARLCCIGVHRELSDPLYANLEKDL